MINLTDYRDFESYLNYLNGTTTVWLNLSHMKKLLKY
jgi:hypothetical protein